MPSPLAPGAALPVPAGVVKGTVATSGGGPLVAVQLGGDTSTSVTVAWAGSFPPVAGNACWIIKQGDQPVLALPAGSETGAGPLGVLGFDRVTASQGGFTTGQDITGLSTTFDAVSGRRYLATLQADFTSDTAGDIGIAMITDGSNTILKEGRTGVLTNAGQQGTCTAIYESAAISGTVTWKARMRRNAGASTGTMQASGTNPAFLMIQDLGRA